MSKGGQINGHFKAAACVDPDMVREFLEMMMMGPAVFLPQCQGGSFEVSFKDSQGSIVASAGGAIGICKGAKR